MSEPTVTRTPIHCKFCEEHDADEWFTITTPDQRSALACERCKEIIEKYRAWLKGQEAEE